MPNRPRSSLELLGLEFSSPAMLMNSRDVETLAVLSNTRTEPVFCTTYQRAETPGSCSMAMGCVKFGRFGNTRCVVRATGGGGGGGGGAALVVALAEVDAADSLAGVAAAKARTV